MKKQPNVLVIGETIIDKYPDSDEIGGAPLNFACHFKLNGGYSQLLTALGNDAYGNKINEFCLKIGLNTDLITKNKFNTGMCLVTENIGVPDYELLSPSSYDYLTFVQPSVHHFDSIYFGTLIQRTENNKQIICDILERNSFETVFCDINLRKNNFDYSSCELCFKHANILKISEEETPLLKEFGLFDYTTDDNKLLANIFEKYENIKQIIYTKGSKGSVVYNGDKYFEFTAPKVKVISSVGAGDAYSATYLYAYLNNYSLEEDERINTAGKNATRIAAETVKRKAAVPIEIYL